MPIVKHRLFLLLAALAIIAGLTYFAYKPGLSGPFIFDDAPNITNNSGIAIQNLHWKTLWQAAFSSASGPLSRPVSMLSFALNYYVTGYNSYYFKLTNLVIHILCGIGIFCLSSSILKVLQTRSNSSLATYQQDIVSLFVTAAWLFHPLSLTSVLYTVQRMTSLSALFCIWGLVIYLRGRLKQIESGSSEILIVISLLVFAPLAILSKETGALLPLLFLVAELTLLNFKTKARANCIFLTIFFAACVVLPATIALAYTALHPQWITGVYSIRDFTLAERVMTEARVLCYYLKLILLPGISDLGLYHDDIPLSHGLLDPFSTLTSIIAIILMLAGAFISRKKFPALSFGVLFFFTGHILESTVFGLEIAHEHRNYLPMFGPIFALFYYVLFPLENIAILKIRRLAALMLISLFGVVTHSRSHDWANPFDLYSSEVRHHPSSARTNLEMGTMFGSIETPVPEALAYNYTLARSYYEKTSKLDPNFTSALVGLIKLSAIRSQPIQPEWVEELRHRLRYSPPAPSTTDSLISLITCRMDSICKLSDNEIEGLLKASLDNPSAKTITRASILTVYSYYLVNITANYPKATEVMQEAIEVAPNQLEYRMTLIEFCTATRQFEKAKIEILKLQDLDTLNKYKKQIETVSKKISEALTNQR
ncbi:hypothetical protein ACO0LO_11005 [Undibacterium sp. TJN25]|uniref:hypothetical protein n=1 Tax=Undibacterium sp. TJN25 TaxID=3413056 RepID=UPI003BF166A6